MPDLNQRIREFYDGSTNLWLDTWGEHMHHGYYDRSRTDQVDRYQAQKDLIEKLLGWGEVDDANRIFDAGCGVAGSSRYLVNKFDATSYAVTLSPVQQREGQKLNELAGLGDRVEIETHDMMTIDPAKGPFDLIWSMESAEHIRDKRGMLNHFYSLLKPGGHLLMATWCRREVPPKLTSQEAALLGRIYKAYHLPPMNDRADYERMAETIGFRDIRTADWSDEVAPFWSEVIKSAMEIRNLKLLLGTGLQTIKGAWAMRYMRSGYRRQLIRYAIVRATKPLS